MSSYRLQDALCPPSSRPAPVTLPSRPYILPVSAAYPAWLCNETSCLGRNVYAPFGHSRGRRSSRWINGLRHSSALSVLHHQNRSVSSKPLIHNAFPHPARGASCVGRLRPQMSVSEFGDKRPSLTGNRAGSVTAQGPRRSLGRGIKNDSYANLGLSGYSADMTAKFASTFKLA